MQFCIIYCSFLPGRFSFCCKCFEKVLITLKCRGYFICRVTDKFSASQITSTLGPFVLSFLVNLQWSVVDDFFAGSRLFIYCLLKYENEMLNA